MPKIQLEDVNPLETKEWMEALEAVIDEEGVERAHFLLEKLIDKSRLSKEEIAWINQYHKLVYAGCAPFLKGEIKTWFKDKCRKV